MSRTYSQLRTGDWVEVKSAPEIANTLDANGALDGLPFMPEMAKLCGQRFRVARRVEKSCVECTGGIYNIREFKRNDVVLLEGSRCSGADHDGCQRGCLIFWRAEWLKKTDQELPTGAPSSAGQAELCAKLKTKDAPDRYFCQSTEVEKITQPQTRVGIILKCYYDVRSGSRRATEMPRLIFGPIWRKIFPRDLVGRLAKTPSENSTCKPAKWSSSSLAMRLRRPWIQREKIAVCS